MALRRDGVQRERSPRLRDSFVLVSHAGQTIGVPQSRHQVAGIQLKSALILHFGARQVPVIPFLHVRQRVVGAGIRFVEFQSFQRGYSRLRVRLGGRTEPENSLVAQRLGEAGMGLGIRRIEFDGSREEFDALTDAPDPVVQEKSPSEESLIAPRD